MATKFPTIENALAAEATTPNLAHLSFVGRRADDTGMNLWCPTATGDWAEDCRIGRGYGHEVTEYVRDTNDAAALGGIVQAIVRRGEYGGAEAGFFAALSMALSPPA